MGITQRTTFRLSSCQQRTIAVYNVHYQFHFSMLLWCRCYFAADLVFIFAVAWSSMCRSEYGAPVDVSFSKNVCGFLFGMIAHRTEVKGLDSPLILPHKSKYFAKWSKSTALLYLYLIILYGKLTVSVSLLSVICYGFIISVKISTVSYF